MKLFLQRLLKATADPYILLIKSTDYLLSQPVPDASCAASPSYKSSFLRCLPLQFLARTYCLIDTMLLRIPLLCSVIPCFVSNLSSTVYRMGGPMVCCSQRITFFYDTVGQRFVYNVVESLQLISSRLPSLCLNSLFYRFYSRYLPVSVFRLVRIEHGKDLMNQVIFAIN